MGTAGREPSGEPRARANGSQSEEKTKKKRRKGTKKIRPLPREVLREAEKMNSCASRAHTSNFHFARSGSGSGSPASLFTAGLTASQPGESRSDREFNFCLVRSSEITTAREYVDSGRAVRPTDDNFHRFCYTFLVFFFSNLLSRPS